MAEINIPVPCTIEITSPAFNHTDGAPKPFNTGVSNVAGHWLH